MPELPEVETIKNQIAPVLPMKVQGVEYSEVVNSILKDREFDPVGRVLESIERRGKVLLLHFGSGDLAISGLGMSGGWRISKSKVEEKHTHIQFFLSTLRGKKISLYLAYVDPRRFGNFHYFGEQGAAKWLTRLGADVSSSEFDSEYIFQKCQRYPNKEIKPFLLEQNHFAGVGNYMASEICARAGILPTRTGASLSKKDAQKLYKATQSVLDDTLATGGTTFSGGYKDTSGSAGQGVRHLVVFYQEICQLCGKTIVIKTIQKGRGTYHCPRCQK